MDPYGVSPYVAREMSGTGTPSSIAHVDQNKVPNNLLVNEPFLSTQGIGGSCGR
jgi:hypothetical protein